MLIRVFAFCWLLLCSVAANALTPPALTVEYSADRKIETDGGDMQGRVNAAPGVERNETVMQGMSSVMILRMDEKASYLLMPAQKMYQVLDIGQASKQVGSVSPEHTEMELVGEETVSGQATNKYKFVMKDKSAGGFLWYTATGIPVKMDVLSKNGKKKERMTVTLENIKIETQDPSLFEVPAGFNKLPGAGGGLLGGGPLGGLLGGIKDAVTRPVKNEASAVASEVAAAKQAPVNAVEGAVTEEVKKAGARAAVRGAIKSVGGLFRKN